MKKLNKKGFTLAELLIVVAIIAVLVAIAVPLFVGGVKKAQEARDDANIRAAKSEAAVYLLSNVDNKDLWPVDDTTGNSTVKCWVITTAKIKADGSIEIAGGTNIAAKTDAVPADTKATIKWENGECTIGNIVLTLSEVK